MLKLFKIVFCVMFVLSSIGCDSEASENSSDNDQAVLPTPADVSRAMFGQVGFGYSWSEWQQQVNFEYTVDGKDVSSLGIHSASTDTVIRVNFSFEERGTPLNFEQDMQARQVIRNLFSKFKNVTITLNNDKVPLPTRENIIGAIEALGAKNVGITNYTVGSYTVPDIVPGVIIINPMPASSDVNISGFFTGNSISDSVVNNAVKSLFSNFTGSITITFYQHIITNPTLPSYAEIINAAERGFATNINITNYTAGGVPVVNTSNPGSVPADTIINLRLTYTSNYSDSAVTVPLSLSMLFYRFTNRANTFDVIKVDDAINTARLPSQEEIIAAVEALGCRFAYIYSYNVGNSSVFVSEATSAQVNSNISIEVIFVRDGAYPSDAVASEVVANLFSEFTGTKNIVAHFGAQNSIALPTREAIIREVELLGGKNVMLTYKVNNWDAPTNYIALPSASILLYIDFYQTGGIPSNNTVLETITPMFQEFTGPKDIRSYGF